MQNLRQGRISKAQIPIKERAMLGSLTGFTRFYIEHAFDAGIEYLQGSH